MELCEARERIVEHPTKHWKGVSSHWIAHRGKELEEALYGDEPAVKLVDAQWLINLHESGGKVSRRQDLPPEAFISLLQLVTAGLWLALNRERLRGTG